MNKNSIWRRCKIRTSKLHSTATFSPIKFDLYKKIYSYLPENKLADTIIKVRMINNLDRKEFGEAIGKRKPFQKLYEMLKKLKII